MTTPLATHAHTSDTLPAALEFLKRTRWEMRELRFVRVWKDKLHIIDVNKDCFEVHGLGYENPDILPILAEINAAYNPETIHQPIEAEYKEFDTGRRYTWANDRVM